MAPLRRHALPTRTITHMKRADIPSDLHPRIDSALKSLRVHSRRLNSCTVMHTDEVSILERLYYKSKNQHRSALFWRKIIETRRHCYRVNELSLPERVDTFRAAFFGESSNHQSGDRQKLLRSAWTHIPDREYMVSINDRFTSAIVLLEKLQSVCHQCYKSLSLAMQSGAFAQLILTLIAVISRISQAISESSEVCNLIRLAISSIVDVLATTKVPDSLLPQSPSPRTASTMEVISIITPLTPITDISEQRADAEPGRSQSTRDSHKTRKQRQPRQMDEIDRIFGF